ncbi:HAD family hydrolase [Halomicrobium sp. IBSBa]|uniref:HAD family hydrolase n=1 Tax=Halomicrobium sp. IBSBa TaxID=2778916 RepID=UPI001ABFF503|nr:HAD family hydrolase [Halomicrobium sp. IBSBa]MBO4246268.1 HAD family hydrolase [Halomicrobium sp. IBSBa]
MKQYDRLYRLYDDFDTASLRAYQEFVDLFPPVDSRVALDHWQDASDELDERKREIREAYPTTGERYAAIAAYLDRDQAFTALDLATEYGRPINALVLDVDETLRSAGTTDNEIPRETLHFLHLLHEDGIPIVVCTGQTLENVKGFLIQGLGNAFVHSGDVSIVYESGNGVFTPRHGSQTKQLLYESLDESITNVFDTVRSRILADAPDAVARGCHLQGNEFNVTLKPNAENGTRKAVEIIDDGLLYLLDLLGETVASEVDADVDEPGEWARAYYASDPEIRAVIEDAGEGQEASPDETPPALRSLFDRIDVGYYEGDAAEIVSLELDKPTGVRAAFDVLDIDDPFALVMGDSKSDLRVMEWLERDDAGIAAAPEHASRDVLDHVVRTNELLFDEGDAAAVLAVVYGLNRLVTSRDDADA